MNEDLNQMERRVLELLATPALAEGVTVSTLLVLTQSSVWEVRQAIATLRGRQIVKQVGTKRTAPGKGKAHQLWGLVRQES